MQASNNNQVYLCKIDVNGGQNTKRTIFEDPLATIKLNDQEMVALKEHLSTSWMNPYLGI